MIMLLCIGVALLTWGLIHFIIKLIVYNRGKPSRELNNQVFSGLKKCIDYYPNLRSKINPDIVYEQEFLYNPICFLLLIINDREEILTYLPEETLVYLLNGGKITATVANTLEFATGVPSVSWLHIQETYDIKRGRGASYE